MKKSKDISLLLKSMTTKTIEVLDPCGKNLKEEQPLRASKKRLH
jgi:hypothetical protein